MFKSLNKVFILALVTILSLFVLAACTPAAPATEEAPVEEEPMEEEAVEEEAAEEEPMEEETMEEETMEEVNPFTDVRVRQAFAYLIDREEIVDRAVQGRADALYSMVPPGFLGANEAFLDVYGAGADVDAAEALLMDAGYSEENPLMVELWYPPEHYGTYAAQIFQVLEEQFEATPLVQVELMTQEWSTYVGAVIDGEYYFSYLGWFFDYPDPSNYMEPFALCDATIGTFYCSEEMDSYFSTGRSSADQAERAAAYEAAQTLYAEDVVTIPLTIESEYVVYREDTIAGVVIGPAFRFEYDLTEFVDGVDTAGDLIIGTTDQITSLDYQDAYAVHDWELFSNANEGLMTFAPGTAEVVPGTAADFPTVSEDGLTYTFTLAEGWAYPDGTPLVAGDYVRGIERAIALADASDVASTLVTPFVAAVEAPDDATVVITLTEPVGFFPQLVASAAYYPIAEGQYPADELDRFPETLVGVGPWQISEYVPNEQTVLTRNPNYGGEFAEGAPERVIIRYFEDPTTMGLALENGEIHVAWRVLGPIEAARLGEVEGLVSENSGGGAIRYLVINHAEAMAE